MPLHLRPGDLPAGDCQLPALRAEDRKPGQTTEHAVGPDAGARHAQEYPFPRTGKSRFSASGRHSRRSRATGPVRKSGSPSSKPRTVAARLRSSACSLVREPAFLRSHGRDPARPRVSARSIGVEGRLGNHQRATLEGVKGLEKRIEEVREIGFRLAIDDLGAGYAGLTTFAQLDPDVVKLDMSLVRDVEKSPIKAELHPVTLQGVP